MMHALIGLPALKAKKLAALGKAAETFVDVGKHTTCDLASLERAIMCFNKEMNTPAGVEIALGMLLDQYGIARYRKAENAEEPSLELNIAQRMELALEELKETRKEVKNLEEHIDHA